MILAAAAVAALCPLFAGCSSTPDYYSFVSEERNGLYLYAEDAFSFKIHCTLRETPYLSDGIKGEVTPVVEFYFNPQKTYNEVEVEAGNFRGEMNYLAVTKSYYLSFTGDNFNAATVDIKLTLDGKETAFKAATALYDGVIDARTALKCVTEYDGELFASLSEGRAFKGEIYIRLLYDDGCYYYVGVCDRAGNTTAYLVDGENGRVIAQKKN